MKNDRVKYIILYIIRIMKKRLSLNFNGVDFDVLGMFDGVDLSDK